MLRQNKLFATLHIKSLLFTNENKKISIYLKIFFTFFFLETNTKRKQQFLKQIRMIIFIENK